MAEIFISYANEDWAVAKEIKDWIARQGFTSVFIDQDRETGLVVGEEWEAQLLSAMRKCHAVVMGVTPAFQRSTWCFAEYTLAKTLGKKIFPVVVSPIGEYLVAPNIQHLNLTSDREGGLQALARRLTEAVKDPRSGFDLRRQRAPFPGLRPFDVGDAAIYFGRDDEAGRLLDKMRSARGAGGAHLVTILGASGSGKSSFLSAGVVPRLRRDAEEWIVLDPARPRRRPIDEIARSVAIAAEGALSSSEAAALLRADDPVAGLRRAVDAIKLARRANRATVVFPIDQAEEAFTLADPLEREAFRRFLAAVGAGDEDAMAVLALRSDFLPPLQALGLPAATSAEFTLGPMPMTLAKLHEIILGPARLFNLEVSPELIGAVADDAGGADALPLIAFAMAELYERRGGADALTLADYRALAEGAPNTLQAIVERRADALFDEAGARETATAALADAFSLHLSDVDENGAFVRRPALWSALPQAAKPALERMISARLLVASIEPDSGERQVEVAHEALLRQWPRARRWLDLRREFLMWRRDLQRALKRYEDWRRERGGWSARRALLAGYDLMRAKHWIERDGPRVAEAERVFVRRSALRDLESRRMGPVFAMTTVMFSFWLVHDFLVPWQDWPFNYIKSSFGDDTDAAGRAQRLQINFAVGAGVGFLIYNIVFQLYRRLRRLD